MRPVSGGTQKLTMNSQEGDYQQLLKQAIAQGDGNPSIFGIQAMNDAPAQYEVANNPATQVRDQADSIELGSTQTESPQESPEDMETDALEKRLALYQEAGNAAAGNNNRAQTMRMG